jgi:hypothetical protein
LAEVAHAHAAIVPAPAADARMFLAEIESSVSIRRLLDTSGLRCAYERFRLEHLEVYERQFRLK